MELSTRCIVLRVIRYNDNYNIVDVYTEALGRCSLMVSIPKSKRSKNKNNFYQPLFLLNVGLIRKSSSGLFKVNDVQFDSTPQSIPYNPYKTAIAFFISEFIYHVVQEEEENAPMFSYLYNSILWLDSCEKEFANFHLMFLMRFTLFLGLFPNLNDYKPGYYFDLLNASFRSTRPTDHVHFISPLDASKIQTLMRMNFDTMHVFKLNRKERLQILNLLDDYYRLHLPSLPELKSLDVLQDLFG